MPHTLKIDWKDHTITPAGGTDLTIKIDGETDTEKHYPKAKIADALKAVEEAVKSVSVKFDNLADTSPAV
jgi:hypothetical protein